MAVDPKGWQQNQFATTVEDLINTPPEEHNFVWGERLLIGGTCLWCGSPKAGKSELSRSLAYCIACGRVFLNEPVVISGPVLMYSFEDSRFKIRKHFEMLFKAFGIPRFPIYVRTPWDTASVPLKLNNFEENHARLLSDFARYKPVLAILDTVFKMVGLSEGVRVNDYEIDMRLAPLTVTARTTGVHIMGLHHTSKVWRGKNSDPFDAFMGSTAIRAWADSNFLLINKRGIRTLQSEERNNDVWMLETPTSKINGMIVAGSAVEATPRDIENEIRVYLAAQRDMDGQHNRYVSAREIRKALKVTNDPCLAALRGLLAQKHVFIPKTKHKKYGLTAAGATASGTASPIYRSVANQDGRSSARETTETQSESAADSTASTASGAKHSESPKHSTSPADKPQSTSKTKAKRDPYSSFDPSIRDFVRAMREQQSA